METNKHTAIILRGATFLIAFILFYKWAWNVAPNEYNAETGLIFHQPFALENTWYVWIFFIATQTFVQLFFFHYDYKSVINKLTSDIDSKRPKDIIFKVVMFFLDFLPDQSKNGDQSKDGMVFGAILGVVFFYLFFGLIVWGIILLTGK